MFAGREPLRIVSSKNITMGRSDVIGRFDIMSRSDVMNRYDIISGSVYKPDMYMNLTERYTLSGFAASDEKLKYLIIDRQEEASVHNKYMTVFTGGEINYNNIIYGRLISNIVNRLSMLIKSEDSVYFNDLKNVQEKEDKNSKTVHMHIKNILSGYGISDIMQGKACGIETGSKNNKSFPHIHSVIWRAMENITGSKYDILTDNQYKNMYYNNMYYNTAYYKNIDYKNIYRRKNTAHRYVFEYNDRVLSVNGTGNPKYSYRYEDEAYSAINKYFNELISCKYTFITAITTLYKVMAAKYGKRAVYIKAETGISETENLLFKILNNQPNIYGEAGIDKNDINIINMNKAVMEVLTEKYKAVLKKYAVAIKTPYAAKIIATEKQLTTKPVRIICNRLKSIFKHTKNIKRTEEYFLSYGAEDISVYADGRKVYLTENVSGYAESRKVYLTENISDHTRNKRVYSEENILEGTENIQAYSERSISENTENIKGNFLIYLFEGILRDRENILRYRKNLQIHSEESILSSRESKIMQTHFRKKTNERRESLQTYYKGNLLRCIKNIQTNSTENLLKITKSLTENSRSYFFGSILDHQKNMQKYFTYSISRYAENIKLYSVEKILRHIQNVQKYSVGLATENMLRKKKQNVNRKITVNKENHRLTYTGQTDCGKDTAVQNAYNTNKVYNTGNMYNTSNMYNTGDMYNTENAYNTDNVLNIAEMQNTGFLQRVKSIRNINSEEHIESTQDKNYLQNSEDINSLSYLHSITGVESIKGIVQSVINTQDINTKQVSINTTQSTNIRQSTDAKQSTNIRQSIDAKQTISSGQAIQSPQDMKTIQRTGSIENIYGNIINRTESLEDILSEQEKAEDINRLIDIRIQGQVKNISRQVYETIERRLQGEKRRRGF